jgi:hypothetical protein
MSSQELCCPELSVSSKLVVLSDDGNFHPASSEKWLTLLIEMHIFNMV